MPIPAAAAQMNLEVVRSNYQFTIASGPIDSTAAGAAVNWTGGILSGTLNVQGTFNVTDSGVHSLDAGTINLSGPGASTWSGTGDVRMSDGSVFNNLAGSTFTIENDAPWIDDGSGATRSFNNYGILIKSGMTGSTTFDMAFNNSGTVNVQSGTLILGSGGTIDAGARFTGPGVTDVDGGTVTVGGLATAANLALDARHADHRGRPT